LSETKTRRSTVKRRPLVVFDSNIYIAYLLSKNPQSPSRELFQYLQTQKYDLLWCEAIRKEVIEKALEKGIPPRKLISFLADLSLHAKDIDLSSVVIQKIVNDDPDDDSIVACALEGKARYLVSYDPHLLKIGRVFRGIRILNGLHFLYVIRGDKSPK